MVVPWLGFVDGMDDGYLIGHRTTRSVVRKLHEHYN
jgi:hypothetical protein